MLDAEALRPQLLKLLETHTVDQWNWNCSCGEMEPATASTHGVAYRAHLTEALLELLHGGPVPDSTPVAPPLIITCSGCSRSTELGTEGWRRTDAYWCPDCVWLA